MKIIAAIWHSSASDFWLAECTAFRALTQGTSQDDALEMLGSWFKDMGAPFPFRIDAEYIETGAVFVLIPKDYDVAAKKFMLERGGFIDTFCYPEEKAE